LVPIATLVEVVIQSKIYLLCDFFNEIFIEIALVPDLCQLLRCNRPRSTISSFFHTGPLKKALLAQRVDACQVVTGAREVRMACRVLCLNRKDEVEDGQVSLNIELFGLPQE